MKVKKVNRYYCDFCRKGGCGSGAMKHHESGCTKNPNRVCRMCVALGEDQSSMVDLIAMIPPEIRNVTMYDIQMADQVEKIPVAPILKELREKANDCPICIFAAIRQTGAQHFFWGEFKMKEEVQKKWDDINSANESQGMYY